METRSRITIPQKDLDRLGELIDRIEGLEKLAEVTLRRTEHKSVLAFIQDTNRAAQRVYGDMDDHAGNENVSEPADRTHGSFSEEYALLDRVLTSGHIGRIHAIRQLLDAFVWNLDQEQQPEGGAS